MIDAGRSGSLNVTNNSTGQTGANAISSSLPGSISQAAQPAAAPPAPAAPAAAPAAPAAPVSIPTQSCGGLCGSAMKNYEDVVAGRIDISSLSPEARANVEAIGAAHSRFGDGVTGALGERAALYEAAIKGELGETRPGLLGAATLAFERSGMTPVAALERAQAIERATVGNLPASLSPNGTIPGVTRTTTTAQSQPPATGSAPAAAATTAAGIAPPTSGLMADGVHTSTVTSLGNGNYESKITDASGNHVATQTHNPGTLTSQWNSLDAAGNVTESTFAYGGTLTAISTGGQTIGFDHSGNVMAGGWVDAEGFMQDGRTGAEVTEAERATLQAAQIEQGLTNPDAGQFSSNGTISVGSHLGNPGGCFLPGTLVSTPNGPTEIETLKPGDKVYSFNEKTGQKQISDFKKLDINFVDEYLIINGKINSTIYHPFYIVNQTVTPTKLITIRADQLKIGDILQNEAGKYIPVYSIEKIQNPQTTVYNLLNVTPNKNFYAEDILVHNYADGSEFDSSSLTVEVTGGSNWDSGDSGWSGAESYSSDTTSESSDGGYGGDSSVDNSSSSDNSGNSSND